MANQRIKLEDLKFGEHVTRSSLGLGDLTSQQDREVNKVMSLLAERSLQSIAQVSQGSLYNELRAKLHDELGIATPSLLRVVRQAINSAKRQLEVRRLQFVNRATSHDYKAEELADMSLFALLQMVIDHPHAAPYVEDVITQRVKRVQGPWVVPLTNREAGKPNINLHNTVANVHRYDGVAESVPPNPVFDDRPVRPITFREAFAGCNVF